MSDSRYRTAFLDWLACAARGRSEPAARAAEKLGEPVTTAATAGHVLDFDDTYLPGLAHLSAPSAPAALVVGAERGARVDDVLSAYARGFEAMGAVARACHPALYDGHYHPTAVCGGVGAAVAAATLLGLGEDQHDNAVGIALVGAFGLRAAFGSHGKSLQVGLAAAAGVRAARLAEAGARVPLARAARGFADATGGAYERPDDSSPAIAENWIKAWPCCLQTHGAIEAATIVSEPPPLTVTVHPVSLQAAAYGPTSRRRAGGEVLDPLLHRVDAAPRSSAGGELRNCGRRGLRARLADQRGDRSANAGIGVRAQRRGSRAGAGEGCAGVAGTADGRGEAGREGDRPGG